MQSNKTCKWLPTSGEQLVTVVQTLGMQVNFWHSWDNLVSRSIVPFIFLCKIFRKRRFFKKNAIRALFSLAQRPRAWSSLTSFDQV